MKKLFKTTSKKNKIIIKVIVFLMIMFLSSVITFNLLLNSHLDEYLKSESFHEDLFSYSVNQRKLMSLKLLDPSDMLKIGLNYYIEPKTEPSIDELELTKSHINDESPRVYIYNTHDSETYDSSLLESYNIKYSVKIASYILSEYLKDYGIKTYVETESMADYLSLNGLLYKNSYEASRYYLERRLAEYPSIDLVIDLHRDSVGASATKVNIDAKNYAKVLFVVGLDYENFENNLSLAELVNSKLDPKLTRGITKKSGKNVNGIYNQDVFSKSLLIEVGGVDNSITEVDNTLKELARIIFQNILGE